MIQAVCDCGHEKRDHVTPLALSKGSSSCKVCLCDHFVRKGTEVKIAAPAAPVVPMR